jgi:hypothetical protein
MGFGGLLVALGVLRRDDRDGGHMAYREVRMVEVCEVLRLWLRGEGLRSVAGWVSLDRKTVRGYVEAGRQAGLDRDRGEEQLSLNPPTNFGEGSRGAGFEWVRRSRKGPVRS